MIYFRERGANHIKIFGGGGGVILARQKLKNYRITELPGFIPRMMAEKWVCRA